MDKHKRRYSSSSDSAEEHRLKDIKERDEFAKRLKKRDEEKVKKVAESSSKRSYEEAAKRLKLEAEDREKILPKLRIHSRRKYLEKRKDDKVIELEADIADDEYLFDESRLVHTLLYLTSLLIKLVQNYILYNYDKHFEDNWF